MLLVYSFSRKDAWLVRKSLAWMKELGGCKNHDCLLLVDETIKSDEEYKLALEVFNKVGSEKVQVPSTQWPQCANFMWQHAARFVEVKLKVPWFFMEPDCIPIKPMWLDQIEDEYKRIGKPFMITSGGIAPHHNLCGNAVYPAFIHRELSLANKHLQPHEALAAMTTESEPWDAFIRDIKVGVAKTDLIYHDYGNEAGKFEGKALIFNSRSQMQKIMDSRAVLVHRCKDGSCIDVLSSNAHEKSFGHSGDLGDIVFAMGIIKASGGGTVYLKSDSNCREPLTETRFSAIQPLLKSQSYIKDVKWWKDEIVCFDFSEFRKEHKPNLSLLESQRKYIGAPEIEPRFPWLMIQGNDNGLIVISRTGRYNNPTFPWNRLVQLYKSRMIFLGLPEEHKKFCTDFGEVPYQPTLDLLEAAKWISGSQCFIGNQSSLYAIAEGIKHRRICEVAPDSWSQNVFLDGGQVQYVLSGSVDESWLQQVKPLKVILKEPEIMVTPVVIEKKRGRPKKVIKRFTGFKKQKNVTFDKTIKLAKKMGKSYSLEDAIKSDKQAGMGWKDLLSKHKVSAVALKKILG